MGEKLDPITGELVPDPYHELGHALVPVEVHAGPLPAHPHDLRASLERWKDDREYVKRFLLEYLEESEYNEKGLPAKGRMHDYYRLPGGKDGEQEYRPTEVGAEKVALFFGLFKTTPEITVIEATKDHVAVKARVQLVDARGNVRGASEKVGSSAEQTFQAAAYKYKGDWRAALNDICSRIAKRAYVEAVTVTCALGELFNEIAREKARQPRGQVSAGAPASTNGPKRADPKPDARGCPTVMPVGAHAGEKLTNLKTDFLLKAREACRGRAEYDKLSEAIGEILEQRREAAEGATT